jgi:alpha-glucosidase
MAELHYEFGERILQLVKESIQSGEPIVRFMEYNYPHRGYHSIKDQFMLGEDILVAPVIDQGVRERMVVLPKGRWKDDKGNIFEGEQSILVPAPLGHLIYYTRV